MREGIIAGSDNVFADIGHPRPEEALAKAQLAHRIATIITQRGLTGASRALTRHAAIQGAAGCDRPTRRIHD